MSKLQIKLLKDYEENDLIFKPVRKTPTGSRIIDVKSDILFQTCWLTILGDIEYNICVDSEQIKDILQRIDERVIEHASKTLGFERQEIIKMYKPLLRNNTYFCISILTSTVLFDRDKNFYDKSEIKNILRSGHNVRFLLRFKKIYFKDNELTFPLELQQIELA